MEAKKYRAVDSNGNVSEVTLAKHSKPVEKVEYARAPQGNGYSRNQSQKVAR